MQASSVTYTRSSNQTQTQGSTASSTFSEAGNYYGGNYAFSAVFYEVQNSSNATALLSATNSFTETLSNGSTSSASGGGGLLQSYLSSTSQGTFGSGSGQSVTGGTLDCYTRSDYASNSSTLTEQGNFANGSYNLSNIVYDQTSADTYATLETLVSNQSANPSATQSYTPSVPSQQTIALGSGALTVTSSAGGAGSSSSNGSITANGTTITSFNSYATFVLHETGTSVNGSFNLGCVLYDGGSLATSGSTVTQSGNVLQTVVTSANYSMASSGVSSSVSSNGGSNGTTTTSGTVSQSTTLTTSGTVSIVVHEEGSYSAGTFSLSSWTVKALSQSASSYTAGLLETASVGTDAGNVNFSMAGAVYFTGSSGVQGSSTKSDNLSCYQSATLSVTEAGVYNGGSLSLLCFNLNAQSSFDAAETINSTGSSTNGGTLSNGSTFYGGGSSSFDQETNQSQYGTLTEQGTYALGSFALSSVTFYAHGDKYFSYNKGSNDCWMGGYSGTDSYSLEAGGSESYTATGAGSVVSGNLALSGFQLNGGSTAAYNMADNGVAGTVAYEHSENWNENVNASESGTYGGGSNWSFAQYTTSRSTQDVLADQIGTYSASSTITDQDVISGTGSVGQEVKSGAGWYNNGLRSYSYSFGPIASNVTLAGPGLPNLNAPQELVPALGVGGQAAQAQRGNGNSLLQQGSGGGLGGISAGSGAQLLQSSVASAVVQSGTPGGWTVLASGSSPTSGNGAMLAVSGLGVVPALGGLSVGILQWTSPGLVPNVSGFLSGVQRALDQVVNRAYQDGWQKATTAFKPNPLSMAAGGAWAAATANLPEGTDIQTNGWAKLGAVVDFAVGVLDQLTGGNGSLFLQTMFGPLGTLALSTVGVDRGSSAYKAGGAAGQVVQIVATVAGGPAGLAVRGLGMAGAALNVGKTVVNGDVKGIVMGAVGFAGAAGMGLSRCGLPAVGQALVGVSQVINVASAGFAAGQALGNGDVLGGMLSLAQLGADLYTASKACFLAGTRLLTLLGPRPIEEIQEGDLIWSRDETKPDGPAVLKRVEECFRFTARIWRLRVSGRDIYTTEEHPFGAWRGGWVVTRELKLGDELHSDDGQRVVVEEVEDTGLYATVYNLRIADFHTYFVGGLDWGFSVWAHNACEPRRSDLKGGPHASNRKMGQVIDRAYGTEEPQGRWKSLEAARKAAAQYDPAKANQSNAHSVPIGPGDGVVVYPLPNRGGVLIFQADRAFVRKMGDGKIHTFPIGPEHPLY